jgi:hypothetical protein
MRKIAVLLILLPCLTSACAGGKARTARPPQEVRAAQDQQVYELYRQYLETLNAQRERAGLPPAPIKSYEEFRRSPGTE